MKKLILAVCLALVSCASVADPDRSYPNSLGGIESIQYIKDNLPGTYTYLFNEWRQTNINQTASARANRNVVVNRALIDDIGESIDAINGGLDDLNAGIAGAMAMASLPTASQGKDSVMIGAGIYNGESAIAVGISGHTDDGKILKFSFSADTAGNSGASAGASFEF